MVREKLQRVPLIRSLNSQTSHPRMQKDARRRFPSLEFEPRIYGVGAWTPHLFFRFTTLSQCCGLELLVELGTDLGESYFTFCQATAENKTARAVLPSTPGSATSNLAVVMKPLSHR